MGRLAGIILTLVIAASLTPLTSPTAHAAPPVLTPELVSDINTPTADSAPGLPGVELGGFVYFGATDGTGSAGLWRTDGTTAGTTLVKAGVDPRSLAVASGKLYFAGFDAAHGRELWTSDGTTPGTQRLADIYPGTEGSGPAYFTALGSLLIFTAFEPVAGGE